MIKNNYNHLEVISAITMFMPSIISLRFLLMNKIMNKNIIIGSLGCIFHFPFSAMLHLYRAYGKNTKYRIYLFKLDVSFIHIHSYMQNYAWNLQINKINLIYHILSIYYIWNTNPIEYPKSKYYIDLFTVFGILLSSYELFYIDKKLYFIAIIIWCIGFIVYNKKQFNNIPSSILFHMLLTGPQYCLLEGLSIKHIYNI